MKDYLQESIDESGLNIVHEAAMPAKGSLFDVDSESVGIEQLQGRHNVSQNAVTKLIQTYLRLYLLHLKSIVQENLTATRMDSRDSLNRLNPVDDNNKLEQVNLTSS